MRSIQLLLCVILQSQMLISVWGQESIGCFVQGECFGSLYLAYAYLPQGDLQCLEYCTNVEGSNYFTYKAGDFYCVCFATCEDLSVPDCANCTSGDVSCFEDECFVTNARVNGLFLYVNAAADANECAEECNAVEDCQWFTYDSEGQSCILTADREFITDCPSCTYGHTGCIQGGSSGLTSLFTCGGYSYDSTYLADAEVIDIPSLEGSDPDRTCNQVPNMPHQKGAHFAMWDNVDQSVLCCGGNPTAEYKRCFKYTGEEWIVLGNILRYERRYSSAAKLSDGRYWITGGYYDGEQTSEFYQDGIFLEGPQLPNPMNSHCAVEVEPGFVFMGGNYYFGGEKVFSFDPATGAFESLADMTQERYGHGCGVVDKGDSYDIVVAGGFDSGYYLADSEIYNTATREWRQGPNLPHPIHYMSSVQYKDTFLLVGGLRSDTQYLDTIYQYDQTSQTWILREERLSTPKGVMGAVLAGPPVAECN